MDRHFPSCEFFLNFSGGNANFIGEAASGSFSTHASWLDWVVALCRGHFIFFVVEEIFMRNPRKLSVCLAALTAVAFGAAMVQAATFHLVCKASGNWNDQGIRTSSNYQIGYSTQHPHHQAAYFEFDFTPLHGHTLTSCSITVPGSTDFTITDSWSGHPAGTTTHWFKIGTAPQGPNSASEITTGNNNQLLYINASDEFRNGQLGYAWVQEGLHRGLAIDAWHFDQPGAADYDGSRLQPAVNAGAGNYIIWCCDRFDVGAGSENYVWGNTGFNTGIILNVGTR